MPPAEKFNWHDYIDLRDPQPKNAGDREELDVIAANRAKLEGILDNIARTDDGQALIKQGFEVSGSGRNKIIMSTARPATDHQNGGESGAADFVPQFEVLKDKDGNPFKDENGKPVRIKDENGKPIPLKDEKGEPIYTGYLTVNFNDPGKTGYVVEGKDDSFDTVMDGKHIKVSSQTNIVVHELFHLSDPNLRPHVIVPIYKKELHKELENIIKVEGVSREDYHAMLDKAVDNIIGVAGFSMTIDTDKLFAPDSKVRADLEAQLGRPIDIENDIRKPQGELFLGARGSVAGEDAYPAPPKETVARHPCACCGHWTHEEQATDYTDKFMAKYSTEPPRKGYGNLIERADKAPFTKPDGSPITVSEPELHAQPATKELPRYKPQANQVDVPDIGSESLNVQAAADVESVKKKTGADQSSPAADGYGERLANALHKVDALRQNGQLISCNTSPGHHDHNTLETPAVFSGKRSAAETTIT